MPPDPVETQPSTLVQENGHYLFQIRGLLKGTLMNTQCSLVYLYLHLQLKSSDRLHSYNPYSTAKPPVPPYPNLERKLAIFLAISRRAVNSLYGGHYRDLKKRESVIAGVYFSQTSVIHFCLGFSCCPYYRVVHYSGVPVAGPDLQIRGGRHPDPEIGGTASKQIFFSLQMPQFGLKIRGTRAPRAQPLDPPLGTARRDLTAIETYRQPKW